MTAQASRLHNIELHAADQDTTLQARDLALLCFFVLISDLSYSGLTALVVAYERTLHFDLTTTGWVATAEGVGYTSGALLAALLGRRVTITRALIAGIFAALSTVQFASLFATGAWALAVCRASSGVFGGLVYSIGILTIASSRESERPFALYFGANFASGLLALITIPPILEYSALRGFYICYGASLMACVVLVRWYPQLHRAAPAAQHEANGRISRSLLVSLFVNFVFNGGLWVLAEHFGLQIPGSNPQALSALLAGTMLFGLLGTALTAWVAQRWSHLTLINLGNGGLITSVLIMAQWHSVTGLVIAMAFLNMSVTCFTPAGLAALSRKSARGAQWGNLACQSGYSAGPAVVAALGAHSGIGGLVAICIAAFLFSSTLAWVAIRR